MQNRGSASTLLGCSAFAVTITNAYISQQLVMQLKALQHGMFREQVAFHVDTTVEQMQVKHSMLQRQLAEQCAFKICVSSTKHPPAKPQRCVPFLRFPARMECCCLIQDARVVTRQCSWPTTTPATTPAKTRSKHKQDSQLGAVRAKFHLWRTMH
ncbi:hypothetical protein COO60DRAFT_801136 [Scenedesmus sp. NREL 46B-D3]|nr:hypothetical protein COO60DRAFT_801136 [Scenedesmus sp. NREL 46B-D3]